MSGINNCEVMTKISMYCIMKIATSGLQCVTLGDKAFAKRPLSTS